MDNIFEYIIILFFIISALSSAFKKKPKAKQKEPEQRQAQSPGKSRHQEPADEEESFSFEDIFEIRGSKKQKPNDPFEERSEVDRYFEEALKRSQTGKQKVENKENEFLDPAKQKIEKKEREYGQFDQYVLGRYSSKSVEERMEAIRNAAKADYAKDKIENEKKTAAGFEHTVLKRLKNKKDLRDAVILNEVLGKPRALRRNLLS